MIIIKSLKRGLKIHRKYAVITIKTKYWKPGTNYIYEIVNALKGKIQDGDIIVLSEKALSTAMGNLVDESKVKPGFLAKFLARFWNRIIWGYVLGIVCRLKPETIIKLRNYPVRFGAAHKQLALFYAGFLQALRHYSEGGIDVSNIPYTYVCLPLRSPMDVARRIFEVITRITGKRVTVMIVDGDSTFSFRNIHLAPRKVPVKGLLHFGGVLTFIIGRFFKLKKTATPVAIVGSPLSIDEALEIAELADKSRGHGAGMTVWDMAKRFKVGLTQVTWEMLSKINHRPITIIRLVTRPR